MPQKGRHIPHIIGWYTTIALNTLHITKSNAMNAHSQKSSPPGVAYRRESNFSEKDSNVGFRPNQPTVSTEKHKYPQHRIGYHRPANKPAAQFQRPLGDESQQEGAKKLPISFFGGHFLNNGSSGSSRDQLFPSNKRGTTRPLRKPNPQVDLPQSRRRKPR